MWGIGSGTGLVVLVSLGAQPPPRTIGWPCPSRGTAEGLPWSQANAAQASPPGQIQPISIVGRQGLTPPRAGPFQPPKLLRGAHPTPPKKRWPSMRSYQHAQPSGQAERVAVLRPSGLPKFSATCPDVSAGARAGHAAGRGGRRRRPSMGSAAGRGVPRQPPSRCTPAATAGMAAAGGRRCRRGRGLRQAASPGRRHRGAGLHLTQHASSANSPTRSAPTVANTC
jgi:hypothetical protein